MAEIDRTVGDLEAMAFSPAPRSVAGLAVAPRLRPDRAEPVPPAAPRPAVARADEPGISDSADRAETAPKVVTQLEPHRNRPLAPARNFLSDAADAAQSFRNIPTQHAKVEVADAGSDRPVREAAETTTVQAAAERVSTPKPETPHKPAPRDEAPQPSSDTLEPDQRETAKAREDGRTDTTEPFAKSVPEMAPVLDAERARVPAQKTSGGGGGPGAPGGGGGGGGGKSGFHKRAPMPNFAESFQRGLNAFRYNMIIVMIFTVATNILVLAIPIYLFQISDRVLTSRSVDTLIMLTIVVVGAVVLQAILDAVRRFILMRTAVEIEVQLGAPVLSAAARASLNGTSKEYHVLGDLQQMRSFITSGTLISILDAPLAPIFILAVFLIHPHLGFIVVGACLALLAFATINQRMTSRHFADANGFLSRATLHLDSMTRNAQIINALAMIPEAVKIWGRDTALSLRAQVRAQDRNITIATVSKAFRMLTQVAMLGWGAYLALLGEMTGGMVIAGSIIAARALTPIEGAIEGWHHFTNFRGSFRKIRGLLQSSPFNTQRLLLPHPQGRLDCERILYVPPPTKKVILNGISFSLAPGESMAIIGNSGAGKTTLGKMLVGSILPTSGSVRLDLMDLRNWDERQFGENIGYLPQDVQLFPGTIKANIARMRDDASDADIYAAAVLADVHEMIASLPQGYETVVAADGAPLSGGQKQRIALARAFYGGPRLVVLDEPNSNLDSPGEQALAKALLHAKKEGITVVTITQRTALLNFVDKIMVLNNGSVSMFGERSKVLKALTQGIEGGGNAGPRISKE